MSYIIQVRLVRVTGKHNVITRDLNIFICLRGVGCWNECVYSDTHLKYVYKYNDTYYPITSIQVCHLLSACVESWRPEMRAVFPFNSHQEGPWCLGEITSFLLITKAQRP